MAPFSASTSSIFDEAPAQLEPGAFVRPQARTDVGSSIAMIAIARDRGPDD
jgi:hypothetical protein